MEWDNKMSQARKNLDWDQQIKISIDPEKAARLREEGRPEQNDVCSMCGEYCAVRLVNDILNKK